MAPEAILALLPVAGDQPGAEVGSVNIANVM